MGYLVISISSKMLKLNYDAEPKSETFFPHYSMSFDTPILTLREGWLLGTPLAVENSVRLRE